MKIAFASCMSSTVFKQQPVWDQIAAQKPDRLVLLGDSIYIDTTPYPDNRHPKLADPTPFMLHVFGRWSAVVNHPQFRALASKVPTDVIWDDHDFLWDEHYGEMAIENPEYAHAVRTSRALFNAFRRALDVKLAPNLPGSFPTAYNDDPINHAQEPPPGWLMRDLGPKLKLHLTDGRSWRIKRQMLGEAQRKQMEAAFAAAPNAIHLVASGTVVQDNKDSQWASFDDHAWLLAQARKVRIVVLSGDIHDNRFQAIDVGGGRMLFDATSSGAAIKQLVITGDARQNYGLLTTSDTQLKFEFFCFGKPDPRVPTRFVDIASWT